MTLPAAEVETPIHHQDPPLRILLVEDNLGDARLLQMELQRVPGLAFDLTVVGRLEAALQKLREEPDFDVAFVDLSLPDADGLEAMDVIRHQAPHVPVVVLTGSDNDVWAVRAVQRGAQDYIVKKRMSGDALVRAARYSRERQRAANLRADLLTAVADELRAPLHALLGLVQTLQSAGRRIPAATEQTLLAQAVDSGEVLARLVDGLMDAANSEAALSAQGTASELVEQIKLRMATGLSQLATAGDSETPNRLLANPVRSRLSRTVVVLDETAPSRALTKAAFHCRGHRVIEAVDCGQVCDLLEDGRADVVVIDTGSVELLGSKMLAVVRSRAEDVRVPVVEYGDRPANSRAGTGGARMTKPFAPGELVRTAELAMARAGRL